MYQYIKSYGICPAFICSRLYTSLDWRMVFNILFYNKLLNDIGDRKPYKKIGLL